MSQFEIFTQVVPIPETRGRKPASKLVEFERDARAGLKSGIYDSRPHAARSLIGRVYPNITDVDAINEKVKYLAKRLKDKT